jgi:hypothetical protein
MTPLVRELVLARYDEKQGKCGLCGRPVAECSDPDRDRFPQRAVCYESMALAEANRLYDEAHDGLWHDGQHKTWRPQRTPATPFAPRDGVHLWMSSIDLSPDEEFLTAPAIGSQIEPADEA